MNKASLLIITGLVVGGLATTLWADSDDDKYEHGFFARLFDREHESREASYLNNPQYSLYKTECGDCHMAYPPNMLPKPSWQAMMASLENHFGDNAELDQESAAAISAFLETNSAGPKQGEYSRKVWRSTQEVAQPGRITDTGYFRAKHHEIRPNMVLNNPDIGSFSRCDACHSSAEQGDFEEDDVRIPGYGRWDD
ncbi:MAG: diheme cytochrome c [Chromatiales bacterium]|nr:diheme cytochrome c [Chromatiales bacterium]